MNVSFNLLTSSPVPLHEPHFSNTTSHFMITSFPMILAIFFRVSFFVIREIIVHSCRSHRFTLHRWLSSHVPPSRHLIKLDDTFLSRFCCSCIFSDSVSYVSPVLLFPFFLCLILVVSFLQIRFILNFLRESLPNFNYRWSANYSIFDTGVSFPRLQKLLLIFFFFMTSSLTHWFSLSTVKNRDPLLSEDVSSRKCVSQKRISSMIVTTININSLFFEHLNWLFWIRILCIGSRTIRVTLTLTSVLV